jgi:hypothetical protein
MTSDPHRIATPTTKMVNEPPQLTLRLRMKPKAPTTGYVDGAWWPRSRDLAAELPALLAGLVIRVGQVQRISYNLTEWDAVVRRLDIGGHRVRLGGFNSQGANTIDVIGSDQVRIVLLVVPPKTLPAAAHAMSMTAATRDNTDRVGDLLADGNTSIPEPRGASGI